MIREFWDSISPEVQMMISLLYYTTCVIWVWAS